MLEKLRENERIDQLINEDLKIIQSSEFFSFGMDAVLLAKFPRIPKKGLIVDFCSGNGAVALMASADSQAQIKAIEIQKTLADMTQRSVALNHLESQIEVIADDLKNSKNYLKASTVDLILCNPPYFKVSEVKQQNEKSTLTIARHELMIKFEEICQIAQQLLKPGGHFCLVHRPDRFFELMENLQYYHLQPKRIQFVYPKLKESANLILLDCIKDGKQGGEIFLPPLFVYQEIGEYSEDLREIYYGKVSR
ncbi:MAG: tRNA1(Val) (adenine(37)-N6)-methyltransferase [Lactovum sp.]